MLRRYRTRLAVFLLCLFSMTSASLLCSTSDAWSRETYTVGIRAISPPFSFLAVQDGKQVVRGYSVDGWVMISKLLGVDVQFVPFGDLHKRRQMMDQGKIDFISLDSEKVAREFDWEFISVGCSLRHHLYVNEKCRSVTCMRDLRNKRVVAVTGAPYSPEVVLGDDVLRVASPFEALTMLSQGVVEVFVAPSEQVADYLIDKHRIPHILKKGVILGETPMGVIASKAHPERAAKVRRAFKRLQERGVAAQLHDKWFGASSISDGFKRYAKYIAIASAIVGLIFIAIVAWNVSLKRRVERVANDLRRTEQRYRDLIESSPDMIFLVNEAGDILHANERAMTFLNFPAADVIPNLKHITASDYVEEIYAFLDKVFNDGCDKHEFVMQMVGDQPLEVEIAGRIIQGRLGNELLACLFARNVTERNRMEEELIQSERLGIIGKMAASVAHEVNNPLGIIQANAEDLLYEGSLSEEVKEGLEAIQRNATRAGEITTGLLELASPKPMTVETLDVEDLIRESISLLGPKAKNSEIEVDVQSGPLFIRGDNRALQQVLVNLFFNALENMENGGKLVVHSNCEGEGEYGTVRIVIRDRGKGIPRENLHRIFEPFFTSRKGGFGLGLFITRRMVERHDGIIFAESAPGTGTAMNVEFPAYTRRET